MKKLRICTLAALCIGIISIFSSWGFLVHRTINQLAIYQLPKSLQNFFYKNKAYIVQHSVRPDQRRNSDPTEASKHFIDFEAYGDSAAWKMPHNWDSAVAAYSIDTLLTYGYVPYWIIEMKKKLTLAFLNGNKDSILFYAADLGHYIGDSHVPLHTSLNYDGQLTNQRGLHSLWESTIPEIELNSYGLYESHRAKYLKKPEETMWKSIQNTHKLLKDVFEQEIEATKFFVDSTKYRIQQRGGRDVKTYTTAFARAYSKRLYNTINQQLLNSVNLYADFLYTSWVDAGRPDLKNATGGFTKEEKNKLKVEKKAYRKNELIEKDLLSSRQNPPPGIAE